MKQAYAHEFCFWLSGYLAGSEALTKGLTQEQVAHVAQGLALLIDAEEEARLAEEAFDDDEEDEPELDEAAHKGTAVSKDVSELLKKEWQEVHDLVAAENARQDALRRAASQPYASIEWLTTERAKAVAEFLETVYREWK